jgi:SAM-dependent methyltransferase
MSARRSPTQLLLRLIRPLTRIRRVALWTEILFWWKWMRDRAASQIQSELLDPHRSLRLELLAAVDRVGGSSVRILDVGAGPITTVGHRHPTRDVDVTVVATDVLAPQYQRLLRKRAITPPVPTIFADAERLTEQFAPGSFDIVFAANCVDHMERPLQAIQQMLDVVRPGGCVVLVHFEDEGEKQGYTGLHSSNFHVENGSFILSNERERIDLAVHFGAQIEIHANARGGIVTAELRKRA